MPRDRSCVIGTAVWGKWHVDAFLELNLPTLLADSNLPVFAREIDTTYKIYTPAADAERMRAAPVFQHLQALLPVQLELLSQREIGDPIVTHHRVWQEVIETALTCGSYVMLMPPDVTWSSGSLAHLASLIAKGKRAMFLNWHLRSIGETFIPRFLERYGRAQAQIEVPARELVRLALEHAHPMCGASLRTSPNFPHHSEMIFWPVRGQGLLMHVLAVPPFVFAPAHVALRATKLPDSVHTTDELEFVTDSDDLFMVSLAELGKDAEWYRDNHPLDPVTIGKWWLYYDSTVNDALAGAHYRLHFAEPVAADWRRRELEASALIARLIAAREVLRVWQLLKQMGCQLAAALVAYAIAQGLALRLVPRERPLVVLAPDDSALRPHWDGALGRLLCPAGHRRLVEILRGHCVTGERAQRLCQGDERTIVGTALLSGPFEAPGCRGYVVAQPLLDRTAAPEATARA